MATVTTSAPHGADTAPATPVRRRRRGFGARHRATPYLMLLPALVLELAVHLIPMVVGVWMSLKGLTQFYVRNWSAAPFKGLGNYRVAVDVHGPVGVDLVHSLGVTAGYTVLSVGLSWLLATVAAVLMQRPFRGRALIRTLFLTPSPLPAYAAVITWSFLLQRDTGLLNHIIVDDLHLVDHRPFWLIGGNSFASLVALAVWRTWPFALLCLTAGMQTIPDELYEAAAIRSEEHTS